MRESDERLDALLAQHAPAARDLRLSALPQRRDEVPVHRFSRRFERRMRRLCAEQRRTPRANRTLRHLRRAVAVLLVLLGISGTVYAFRAGVIDVVVQKFREYTAYHYTSDVSITAAAFPEASFGYLSEGMTEVEDERLRTEYFHTTHWEGADGAYLILDAVLVTEDGDYQQIIDTEDADVQSLTIQGEQALLSAKGENVIITWTHQDVAYTLIAYNISPEEAQKIARGIEYRPG